jgi:hypothetical protein
MAYMRGDPYVWSDSERLHIWSASGAEDISQMEGFEDGPAAAGISLTHDQMDTLALMLVAELVRSGKLAPAIEHALATHGENFGGVALRELGSRIAEACSPLAGGA